MTEPGYPVPLNLDPFRAGRTIGVAGKPHTVDRMNLSEQDRSAIELHLELTPKTNPDRSDSFDVDLSPELAGTTLTVDGDAWWVSSVYLGFPVSFRLVRAWGHDTKEPRRPA